VPAADVADVGVRLRVGQARGSCGAEGRGCWACGVGVQCEARAVLRDLEQVYTAFSARKVLLHETRQRQKPIYLPRYLSCPSNAQAQGGRPRGAEPRGATSVRAAVCTAGSLRTRPVPSSFSRSASRRRARTGDSWCCMLITRPPPASSGGSCTVPRQTVGSIRAPNGSGGTRVVVTMVPGRCTGENPRLSGGFHQCNVKECREEASMPAGLEELAGAAHAAGNKRPVTCHIIHVKVQTLSALRAGEEASWAGRRWTLRHCDGHTRPLALAMSCT
jgi:hypothetical protein